MVQFLILSALALSPSYSDGGTVEIVEGWETYYEEDDGRDHYSLEALLADPDDEDRTPANAFKFRLMRGPNKSHKGYDYGAPCGTKVPAKSGGVVTKAGWGTGFGKVVGVRVGKCTQIYAHLSKISVGVGQKVKAGTLLGLSGNTGRSRGPTGCHLHYETCSGLYAGAQGKKSGGGQKGSGQKGRNKKTR